MKVLTVGQMLRNSVRKLLKEADVFIEEEGWSNSSTTWSFLLETKLSCRELQDIVWERFSTVWVQVEEYNLDLVECEMKEFS